jgi:hypothetical protein
MAGLGLRSAILLLTIGVFRWIIYPRLFFVDEGTAVGIEFSGSVPEIDGTGTCHDNVRKAFVALCTNMRTIYPALVLFQQLKEVSSIGDKVIIIPEDLALKTSGLFDALQVKIWRLPREQRLQPDYAVQSPTTRKRDRVLWNKLYVWKLEEHDVVVMLDVDLLIMKNVDELFKMNVEFAGVPSLNADEKIIFWDPPEPFESDPLDQNSWRNFTKPTRFEPFHSGLNSGVVFLRPSNKTFGELAIALGHLKERTCCPTQEFLFRFFELRGKYHRLPAVYNMRKIHQLSPEEQIALSDIKIYHFVEKQKPWLLGRKASQQHEFAKLWWTMADKTDASLNLVIGENEDLLITLRQARHEAISPSVRPI